MAERINCLLQEHENLGLNSRTHMKAQEHICISNPSAEWKGWGEGSRHRSLLMAHYLASGAESASFKFNEKACPKK